MARTSCILCISAALAICGGCGGPDAGRPPSPQIRATALGLAVEFDQPASLLQMTVADLSGRVLAELPAAGRRRRFELPFAFEPGIQYRLVLTYADQATLPMVWTAPQTKPPLDIVIEAPPGQPLTGDGAPRRMETLVAGEAALDVAIRLESRTDELVHFTLDAQPGEGVTLDEADGAPWNGTVEGSLAYAQDQVEKTLRARLAPGNTRGALRLDIRVRLGSAAPQNEPFELVLQRADAEQLRSGFDVGQLAFPAAADGTPESERLTDALVLGDAWWLALGRLLVNPPHTANPFEPYAYQALPISSRRDYPLSLVIESEVTRVDGGQPLLDFAPPEWISPRAGPTGEHLLWVPPRGEVMATLPLYARSDVAAGSYRRVVRVYRLGDNVPLWERTAPLEVIRSSPLVSAVSLAGGVICLAVWIVAAGAGGALTRQIGNQGLVIIGLLGGVHFVASFAARIGGDLLAALLGPFNVFLSGLGNEALGSLVFAATLVLVPRVGTFALASLVVFLLNALYTGQLGLIDVVFVSLSIGLGEACLALSGVTLRRTASTGEDRMLPGSMALPLALGAANGLTLLGQFCLVQGFYRLFFATWYILSVAIVTGLGYGTLGAWLGVRLGRQLRRVAP